MSREIDERIVEMTFDNQQFERGVKTTMGTLDKLKQKLDFKDSTGGIEKIQNAFNRLDFSRALEGSEALIAKFAIIYRWTNKITGIAEAMVKSLVIDPVKSGWDKYAELTKSQQTIMAATAEDFENEKEQIEAVNTELEKLSWFADETSYSMTDMTSNIGKFTSNGVKLDKATTAMLGISNWAAISGAGINEAGRAMYNLSQALSVGSVKLMDWRSIQNANMATKEFKEQVIEAALEMGTLKKVGDDTFQTLKGSEISATKNFEDTLSEGWFSSDVLIKVLDRYGDFTNKVHEYVEETDVLTSDLLGYIGKYKEGTLDISEAAKESGVSADRLTEILKELSAAEYDLGYRSLLAAQEAKTFADAIDATKEAVGSGWATTFQTIFGDYSTAKKVWTKLANELYFIFAEPGNRRNDILSAWFDADGRSKLFKIFENLYAPVKKFVTVFRQVKDELYPAGKLGENLAKVMGKIADATGKLNLSYDTAKKVAEAFFRIVRSIGNLFKPSRIFPIFADNLGKVGNVAVDVFDKVSRVFEAISKIFSDFMSSAVGKAIDWIRDKLSSIRSILSGWWDRLKSIRLPNWMQDIVDWFTEVWNKIDAFVDPVEQVADSVEEAEARVESAYKSIKDLVLEIIRGDWGNGVDRDRALTEAGYDNDAAQAVVNQVWSLQGAWKEGWEEILDSYANTSGMLNKEAGETVDAVEDLEKKGITKNAVLSLKKQSKLLTMLDKTAGYIDEIVDRQKEAEESGKKQIDISKLSLKKQQQLLTLQDKAAGFVPKTFTQLLSEGLRKFVEKLPTYVANIAKAAAILKIKITELASTINTKLGAAIQKVMMFYEKHKPEIDNFVATIKERIASLAGTLKGSFSKGWERLKDVFAGTGPVLEEFFVALMNFDWGTMWETIKTFFSMIGENIGEGAQIAIDKAKAGLGRIGGMFSFIYNTVMSLFGGDKKSDNPEEEIQELAELKDAGPTIEGVITNFTASVEKGELPDTSLFNKVQETLSGIFGVLQVGAGALTTFRLGKLFKGLGDMAGGIGDLFGKKGILGKKGFWSNVEDAIKAFKKRPLVESIRDIVMSFVGVALAIVALGYLPEDKLQQGLDAAKTIAEWIVGVFIAVNGIKLYLKNKGGLETDALSVSFKSMAKALLSLAVACGVMFFAVLAFSTMDDKQLMQGLKGLGGVMAELTAVIGLITKLNKGSITLKGVAGTLIALAAAVLVLYFAVQGFGAMGWGALGRGLVGVLVVVSSIGLILGILTKLNGGAAVIKAAGTILALAIAVDLLTIPVMIFAAMDFLKLVQGIGAVAAILLALGFATSQMNKYQGTWGGLAQNIISLIALIAAIGALCWVVNEFEVDIWKAIGIDLLIGGLVGFMGSLAALGPAFSNLKGVAVSALGIDIAVGIIVGGITAVLEIVTAIDTWIEEASGGTMGFRAMAKKVGDSIETVGESIGKAVTAIKTALGGKTKSELEAGKSAGQVLVDVLKIVGEMYASTGPIDSLIEWASGGEGGKGAQIESAITAVASGFTNSQGILSQLDDSTIDKLNKLIPAFNALKNLVYVAGDTYYDSGAISVENIVDAINDLFTTAAGMDIDRLTAISTGLTDLRNLLLSAVRNPENDLGDVFSDAFMNFVDYGLQALADEFSSDYALLKYTDSATKLCLGLQTAIDTSRSGYERKARRIVGWICEQIAAEVSVQFDSLASSGENIMAGLQGGLEAGARAVLASADRIGRSIVFTLNNALKVHSPSRLTELTGEYVSLGLANGMDNQQSSVTSSALRLADGIRAIVGLASQSVNDNIGPVITPVLDLSNVSRGAASMSGMFGNPTLMPSMSIANARAISMKGSPNVGFSDTANQNGLQSITSEIANIRGDLERLGTTISGMQVVMNTGALVGAIAAPMDGALGQRVVYKNRRN